LGASAPPLIAAAQLRPFKTHRKTNTSAAVLKHDRGDPFPHPRTAWTRRDAAGLLAAGGERWITPVFACAPTHQAVSFNGLVVNQFWWSPDPLLWFEGAELQAIAPLAAQNGGIVQRT
jgi:hypothetical protein